MAFILPQDSVFVTSVCYNGATSGGENASLGLGSMLTTYPGLGRTGKPQLRISEFLRARGRVSYLVLDVHEQSFPYNYEEGLEGSSVRTRLGVRVSSVVSDRNFDQGPVEQLVLWCGCEKLFNPRPMLA